MRRDLSRNHQKVPATFQNGGAQALPKPRRPIAVLTALALGGLVLAIVESFTLLAPIYLSLILVLLVTLALNPVVCRVQRITGGRASACGLLGAALLVAAGLMVWGFLGPMKNSVSKLVDEWPNYWEKVQKPLIAMEQRVSRTEEKLQAELNAEVGGTNAAARQTRLPANLPPPKPVAPLRSGLAGILQDVSASFKAVAFNFTQILVVLGTVFFGVAFTLIDPDPVFSGILAWVPERHHTKAATILGRISEFMPLWALGTFQAMLIVGSLVFALMLPFFGVIDCLMLGFLAGALEAIPYLGPLISAVPAIVLAIGEGGWTPAWVALAYLAVQMIENNLIAPLVMGRRMKLHSLVVMTAILLCIAAFGVLGVLAAAPLAAIAQILHEELYRRRFLPTTTDDGLNAMTRRSLAGKAPGA